MKMKFFIKSILFLFFTVALVVGGGVFYVIHKAYKELPEINRLIEDYAPAVPTEIYDRNGKLIDVISRERREIAKFNEIPDTAKNAFLAIEDKKFYSHHGIHFKRLVGAIIVNLKNKSAVQGASSFTQQLARNAFLTHEKSMSRKIKEAIITFEIERKYTKDEIFEKYLNEIYFGGGAYGIKTASEQFFHKNINQINLPEAALLAGIPNRPETYNPARNLKNAIKRMNLILSEMYNDGFITKEEYEKAKEHKFYNENNIPKDLKIDDTVTIVYNKKTKIETKVPDFTDLVEKELLTMFDENKIYNEGLKVYTTLDYEIQKVAKSTFENYSVFRNNKKLQGGMVTVDPNNGHILAIVGGHNFKTGDFNRGTMARRQLGSSFKPFLYFTAIQNGFELNSVVEDKYLQYGKWIPKNYGSRYSKNMTLLTALDKSINTVSIQLLDRVGIDKVKDNIQKLDEKLKIANDLTSALGSFENTPLQNALDFSVFANGGYKVEPVVITKVEDRYGNEIFSSKDKTEKIYDSIETSLITYMLKSSVANGSSSRASVYSNTKQRIEQGGKTGTTNENRTLWYAGITPNMVTAIYVGYDNNAPILQKITGGSGVAPLWGEFYQKLVNNGLYNTNDRFIFLDNHLRNGDIFVQRLSLDNGLLADDGREFIIRSGKLQVESAGKYANGIGGVLVRYGFGGSYYDMNDVIEETMPVQNSADDEYISERLLNY